VDDWEQVFYSKDITELMQAGQLAQEDLYGEVWEVVTGKKPGRERPEERVLVRVEGLVSQDVAIAHWLYRAALQRGVGTPLPGPG
jgi:ornithine cyclodeaminase/alanine dehydrogenase-like protein (mu-crystallin family)